MDYTISTVALQEYAEKEGYRHWYECHKIGYKYTHMKGYDVTCIDSMMNLYKTGERFMHSENMDVSLLGILLLNIARTQIIIMLEQERKFQDIKKARMKLSKR